MLLKCIIQDDYFRIGILCLFKFRTKSSWLLEYINRKFCGNWKFYDWL